jgi:molecular chaperone HscB
VIDPFATLGLERTYKQDLGAAEKTHRELSRALHPDRHARGGASERRQALEKAVLVNEAWRVVRDPIRRAEALFALAGIAVGETNEPAPAPALLMDMLEQREALAEARAGRDLASVRDLVCQITARQEAAHVALAAAFDAAGADRARLEPLLGTLGELRYYRRFLEEASAITDDVEASS